VVKLRGLPWTATEQNIADFFQPLIIGPESVTIISLDDGRATGEAYVWCYKENAPLALAYNHGLMGSRYVEVLPSDEVEYSKAVLRMQFGEYHVRSSDDTKGSGLSNASTSKSSSATENFVDGVVRLRGLPFYCQPREIADLYKEFNVEESMVYLKLHTSGPRIGQPNGEAFVRFSSVETVSQAYERLNKTQLQSRYVEMFAASESELSETAQMGGIIGYEDNNPNWNSIPVPAGEILSSLAMTWNKKENGDINPQEDRPGSGWLRLRGLQYCVTQHDVEKWFRIHGLEITASDITMKNGTDGRPTGEAFIQMDSPEAVKRAQRILHGRTWGGRYVEAFISSVAEARIIRHNRTSTGSRLFGARRHVLRGSPYTFTAAQVC